MLTSQERMTVAIQLARLTIAHSVLLFHLDKHIPGLAGKVSKAFKDEWDDRDRQMVHIRQAFQALRREQDDLYVMDQLKQTFPDEEDDNGS